MKVRFTVNYRTHPGHAVFVMIQTKSKATNSSAEAIQMNPTNGDNWEVEIAFRQNDLVSYFFSIMDENRGIIDQEFGEPRTLELIPHFKKYYLQDSWRSKNALENVLFTSPFSKSFFSRGKPEAQLITYGNEIGYVRMQIRAPRIGKDYQIGILGSCEAMGRWNPDHLILMSDEDFPIWKADFPLSSDQVPFEYKYVIYSHSEKRVVTWESGENRYFSGFEIKDPKKLYVRTDEYFNYPVGEWKCAGVAIPVFSLRSKEGSGVGEFTDIHKIVDWAVKTGMRMVQVLPVNDTVATHTWKDSYPYAAISVDALHPIYGNMKTIGELRDKKAWKTIESTRKQLNRFKEVDYEAVMQLKSKFYKLSFDENKEDVLTSKSFKSFFKKNQSWLTEYAAFSGLRDKYKTPDFSQWGKHAQMSSKELVDFVSPKRKHYDDVAIHYYIQYHLDKQLLSATNYARTKGVVLKGDIPIGIYRYSIEAWRMPHLFNMDCQTGAPPDDFSQTGQNWGFPTYNWTEMAKDGYQWWKDRLIKMSDYFDVFRIDHILGFFRIWEIPIEAVEGLLGHFNPAQPISLEEFALRGLDFDYDRWCKPYIREHIIEDVFDNHTEMVIQKYFKKVDDQLVFKEAYDTQRKLKTHFDEIFAEKKVNRDYEIWLRDNLYRLHGEVLFLEVEGSEGKLFNPRIGFHSSYSFMELNVDTQRKLDQLYIHYFYHRHNDFWREGSMMKLPVLKDATDMLICGEDLGMVPACVPGVMDELQILSLAIQRMPNDDREFWHPADVPYMYVTSTGSHDMTTLREWWHEDSDQTQRFYNNIVGLHGSAPQDCEAWLAKEIIKQHLHSPSMLALFPIQDLLAMDEQLRRDNETEERINIPVNPQHYWRYRMHLDLEDLLKEESYNVFLRQLLDQGGRTSDY